MNYPSAKKTILDIIDDAATEIDVLAGYGDKFTAKTTLAKIKITEGSKAMMPKRINKAFAEANWKRVGPLDTVKCQTIGDMIKLVCTRGQIALPTGEPK